MQSFDLIRDRTACQSNKSLSFLMGFYWSFILINSVTDPKFILINSVKTQKSYFYLVKCKAKLPSFLAHFLPFVHFIHLNFWAYGMTNTCQMYHCPSKSHSLIAGGLLKCCELSSLFKMPYGAIKKRKKKWTALTLFKLKIKILLQRCCSQRGGISSISPLHTIQQDQLQPRPA